MRPPTRTSFHHQSEAQHPKSSVVHDNAGRLPHLSDLSACFANVAGEQVVAEIETALKKLLEFLDFDRGNFAEFGDGGKQNLLCAVAVEPRFERAADAVAIRVAPGLLVRGSPIETSFSVMAPAISA